MGLSKATFTPNVSMNLKADWVAEVTVHIVDEGSWRWSKPCDTRWGAWRLAKRRARQLRRSYERGELRL